MVTTPFVPIVFDGIGGEVDQHLPDAFAIGGDDDVVLGQGGAQKSGRARRPAAAAACITSRTRSVRLKLTMSMRMRPDCRRLSSRKPLVMLDRLQRFLIDRLDEAARLHGRNLAAQHQFAVGDDAGQRRAQFVHHLGDEIALLEQPRIGNGDGGLRAERGQQTRCLPR